jgi:hypothetical protein
VTAFIPIYSNLFFLMAQAFVSRVFAPGISIFANASVRCPFNIEWLCHFTIQKSSKSPHVHTNLMCTAGFGLRRAGKFCE